MKRLSVAEYPLPGFGYETSEIPTPKWDLYSNWQLAFFSVPDAAQFFVQGKESDMLSWYFYHASYSGNDAISSGDFDRYVRALSKPGFLRSNLNYFSQKTVAADATFFNSTLKVDKLQMPVLALGGEASFAPAELLRSLFGPMATDLSVDIIPKAGHWIGERPFPTNYQA